MKWAIRAAAFALIIGVLGTAVIVAGQPHTAVATTANLLSAEPASDEVTPTVGAVGDSITAWPGSAGQALDVTWPTLVPGFTGEGWAQAFATSDLMAANVTPITADVLVVMAGTNDLVQGYLPAETIANIDAIVAAAQATRVVICAVAPFGNYPEKSTLLNVVLREHANMRGWTFVDAWIDVRDVDGKFFEGMSVIDGYHPTTAGETAAAARISAAIPASANVVQMLRQP